MNQLKLRKWQSECIAKAFKNYSHGEKHFLCLATPGAGKTKMASALAKKLYEEQLIDLVVCFSPSTIVAIDFGEALSAEFNAPFDGQLGSMGSSFTYQMLSNLPQRIFKWFKDYKVFAIFDEIHHCSGSNVSNSNSWGLPLISCLKDYSEFTLSLSGTPWRSDKLPIALGNYDDNTISCNYMYGLPEAISDNVCRVPNFVVLDNEVIGIRKTGGDSTYSSFSDLFEKEQIPYFRVVTDGSVIENLLKLAVAKLDDIRRSNSAAGGLVVASTILHAKRIKRTLQNTFNIYASIVTSAEISPEKIIEKFKHGNEPWLISVGMVSEGTNIPRLQVCCNLTNIQTELYFRQILGRILRKTHSNNQEAFMFFPAIPKLIQYASRITENLPVEHSSIEFVTLKTDAKDEQRESEPNSKSEEIPLGLDFVKGVVADEYPRNETDRALSTIESVESDHQLQLKGKFINKDLDINHSLAFSMKALKRLDKLSTRLW